MLAGGVKSFFSLGGEDTFESSLEDFELSDVVFFPPDFRLSFL